MAPKSAQRQALAGLGVLGFVLALVGLYGLMTYSVGLRQREIGIRIAIGADRTGVVKMVLNEGLTLAGTGVAIGVLLWLLGEQARDDHDWGAGVQLESAGSGSRGACPSPARRRSLPLCADL